MLEKKQINTKNKTLYMLTITILCAIFISVWLSYRIMQDEIKQLLDDFQNELYRKDKRIEQLETELNIENKTNIMNIEQRALDCTTGINRELTTNEKLLVQNDKHLQSHLTILEELLSHKKRIIQLETKLEELEEILQEICNSINEHEKNEIIDPNTNI